jgi:hypothetical protein
MAVDAINDARVISIRSLCCRAIQKPHSDRSVLGKIHRNVFARGGSPMSRNANAMHSSKYHFMEVLVDFATEYANALVSRTCYFTAILFRTIIRLRAVSTQNNRCNPIANITN